MSNFNSRDFIAWITVILTLCIVGCIINKLDLPGLGKSEVYFTLSIQGANQRDIFSPETINYPAYPKSQVDIDNPQPQKHYLVVKKATLPADKSIVRYHAVLTKNNYIIEARSKTNDSLLIRVPVSIL